MIATWRRLWKWSLSRMDDETRREKQAIHDRLNSRMRKCSFFPSNWHNIEWSWKWSKIIAKVNSNNRHTNDANAGRSRRTEQRKQRSGELNFRIFSLLVVLANSHHHRRFNRMKWSWSTSNTNSSFTMSQEFYLLNSIVVLTVTSSRFDAVEHIWKFFIVTRSTFVVVRYWMCRGKRGKRNCRATHDYWECHGQTWKI